MCWYWNKQASSVSTDIKVIPTNASMPAGASLRVLIIVSEDVLRDKWLCHRYVSRRRIVFMMARQSGFKICQFWAVMNSHEYTQSKNWWNMIDWFRIKQKDTPHDALRPQGFPRQQRPRSWPPPYAQQDFRRWVRFTSNINRTHSNKTLGSPTPCRQERESKLLPARSNLVLRLRTQRPELRLRYKGFIFVGNWHGNGCLIRGAMQNVAMLYDQWTWTNPRPELWWWT